MTRASWVPASATHSVAWLRRSRPRPEVVDAAVAIGFLAAMVAECLVQLPRSGGRLPAAIASSVVVAGALAARRRFPLTAYVCSSIAMMVEARFVFVGAVTPNANLVQAYSLGLYATRTRAWFGPGLILAGNVEYFTSIHSFSIANSAGPLILWLLAWAFGFGSARRQEEREAARLVLQQRVVADERSHIARELHDLVGHSLNVMLVQAGAARRVLDKDPAQTRDLLTSLESTGRDAFDELDRVLGLLRTSGPASSDGSSSIESSSPQPGLGNLPRLTERIAQAGVRITMHVDDSTCELPRSVDLSAYRIVQEALTNTVKHARATTADVTVRRRGRVLDIEVVDDGRGAHDGYVTGRGLLGIAERVSMFGGSVEHGSVEQGGGERGGFRVHAVLPVPR